MDYQPGQGVPNPKLPSYRRDAFSDPEWDAGFVAGYHGYPAKGLSPRHLRWQAGFRFGVLTARGEANLYANGEADAV